MKIQPITRKERFLNEIVGWGETAPEKPTTPEEFFFAAILGEAVQVPEPLTRYQMYLAKIAGRNISVPKPLTRLELFLAKAAGMDVVTPVPLTKEEIFWANYKGIEQIAEGVPPLTFKSNGANLSNYRIYGNTVNGESVGDLVQSGEHAGEYRVPVTINSNTTSIYLPYQIRKVGDEVEYISYSEQKQHRVRKNLFDAAKSLVSAYIGGINFDYTISSSGSYSILLKCMPNATYTATFPLNNPNHNIRWCSFDREPAPGDIGSNTLYIAAGGLTNLSYTTSTDAAYMMLFLYNSASPPPQSASNYFQSVQIEKGSTATDYEPYIEDTELDVTLPALPTLSGTNTLTVGTEVQPSKVMIKTGKFGTHKVRYYDSDGTFLSAEDVKDGTNAQGFTPTKTSTVQYNYTFMGWSTTKGSTTAETGVLDDITADKSLYAVFSQSLRTFTVYFYNGSTLLQTAENVQYGGTATYTGTTPTKSGYIFDGWNPSNTNITADTSCYAQFKEDEMYESITDTWSQIIANIGNGTYSTKYQVGDTKKIDLGTEGEVIMAIVGIDADDLADNSGKAPITWISKQLLKTKHRMNPSRSSGTEGTGSLGGWEKTEMRSYLKETVKPLIPETVRNAIKPVKKYSRIYNVSGSAVNDVLTTEDVWIPSYKEVFGSGLETLGPTYSTAFPDNASRIKRTAGSSAAWWWLRSAYNYSTFNYVDTDGSSYSNLAGLTGGVALGFCT